MSSSSLVSPVLPSSHGHLEACRVMAKNLDRDKNGQFVGDAEKKTEKIWLRIPNTLYLDLIDLSDGNIPDYARQALIEKIEREKQSA